MLHALAFAVLSQTDGRVVRLGRYEKDPISEYKVTWSAKFGYKTASVTSTLTETFFTGGEAIFSVSGIKVSKNGKNPEPWKGTPPTQWSEKPISAQSIFGLSGDTCKIGDVLTVGESSTVFFDKSQIAYISIKSGQITASAPENFAGLLRISDPSEESPYLGSPRGNRLYQVYAKFDPKTGHLRRFDLRPTGGFLMRSKVPSLSLTIESINVK